MLLAGKTVLVTGVLTPASIAYRVAELAQAEGARVVLTSFGRHMPIARRAADQLPQPPLMVELDVASDADLQSLAARLQDAGVTELHGVVHSVAAAAPALLGGDFANGAWPEVATMLQTSAFSYPALVRSVTPLLASGSAIVGITFDSQVAWPAYNWMGVAKAALESANRYMARDLGPLGIRANLVAAGPIRTKAAAAIPGFDQLASQWSGRAPLGWDVDDSTAAAKAVVALLSDWFPATTGEIIQVDGGTHAVA